MLSFLGILVKTCCLVTAHCHWGRLIAGAVSLLTIGSRGVRCLLSVGAQLMKCRSWCGLCYAGRRGRATYRGHYGAGRPRRHLGDSEMSWFDRRVEGGSAAPDGSAVVLPEKDREKFPALVEFLSLTKYSDGSSRQPGTVMLFVDAGRLKACLNCKDEGLVAFVTLEGIGDAMARLERAITDGRCDWRKARDRGGRR